MGEQGGFCSGQRVVRSDKRTYSTSCNQRGSWLHTDSLSIPPTRADGSFKGNAGQLYLLCVASAKGLSLLSQDSLRRSAQQQHAPGATDGRPLRQALAVPNDERWSLLEARPRACPWTRHTALGTVASN